MIHLSIDKVTMIRSDCQLFSNLFKKSKKIIIFSLYS